MKFFQNRSCFSLKNSEKTDTSCGPVRNSGLRRLEKPKIPTVQIEIFTIIFFLQLKIYRFDRELGIFGQGRGRGVSERETYMKFNWRGKEVIQVP